MSVLRAFWDRLRQQSGGDSSGESESGESESDEPRSGEVPTDESSTEETESEEADVLAPAPALASPSTKLPKKPKQEVTKQKNIAQATKKFATTGSDFASLKGTDKLNDRQKTIFDAKLKKAIEADRRSTKGTMSDDDLKKIAQKVAEATEKLSKTPLSQDVNDLSLKSATLKDKIVELKSQGWEIKIGKRGKGSFAQRDKKRITIDPSATTKQIVMTLAHETGHATYTAPANPPISDPSPDVAKGREYIRKVVENNLLDEGQAQIVACQAAKELEDQGETGMNIPGGNSAQYKAIYDKIVAGTLTMDQGRIEMAKIMATETTSNEKNNYVDYYSAAPRKAWNKAHKKAKVPATPRVTVFP